MHPQGTCTSSILFYSFATIGRGGHVGLCLVSCHRSLSNFHSCVSYVLLTYFYNYQSLQEKCGKHFIRLYFWWQLHLKVSMMRELIIDQLVGFLVVESIHPGSSSRLDTSARIFLDLFQDLTVLCFQW